MEEARHITWDFKFQKSMPGPVSFFVPLPFSQDVSSELLFQNHHPTCLPVTMLPALLAIDSPYETTSKAPVKCPLLEVMLAIVSLYSNKKVTKTEVGTRSRWPIGAILVQTTTGSKESWRKKKCLA